MHPEMDAIFVGLLVIALASVAILFFAVNNTRLVLIGLITISVTLVVVLGLALKLHWVS